MSDEQKPAEEVVYEIVEEAGFTELRKNGECVAHISAALFDLDARRRILKSAVAGPEAFQWALRDEYERRERKELR